MTELADRAWKRFAEILKVVEQERARLRLYRRLQSPHPFYRKRPKRMAGK